MQIKSSRVVVAAAIAGVHALVLFALVALQPRIQQAVAKPAITVHFISQPQPQRAWQPPDAKLVPVSIQSEMPDAPIIELPLAAPSEHTITIPTQAAKPSAPARMDAGLPKLVSVVEYLREPSPRYPPQSRRLREQGTVVLRVVIDEQGNACEIEIENSSGYARLDHAAREAVQRAAFRPYIEGGEARRALVLIPIEFALNRSQA